MEKRENKLKLLLKKLFKPLYRPIRHRFENRLISIQESAWRQDGITTEIAQSIHDMDGHLYDYFHVLDERIRAQNEIRDQIQQQLLGISHRVDSIEKSLLRISDSQALLGKQGGDLAKVIESQQSAIRHLQELLKDTKSSISEGIEKAETNTIQLVNARIEHAEMLINQTTDTRIWKAEDLINQTMDNRVWKMERNIQGKMRAGFQNIYLSNCLNAHNASSAASMTYDDIFYFENRAGAVMSARAILSALLPHFECHSMVDFGCGTGTWLWVAHNFGVESIMGLDGDYVLPRHLMIPQDCFCAADLEKPVILEKKYDLAISMEVAEHLHKESADTFVESLCSAADIVLFSAAHPGQGGDGHINEQPMTYWTSKFDKHGFLPIEIRQLFVGNEDIESWYRENIVLYVREAKVHGVEKNLLEKTE